MTPDQEIVVLVTVIAVCTIISMASWILCPAWEQKAREASFILKRGWYNGNGWHLRAIVLIDKVLGGA